MGVETRLQDGVFVIRISSPPMNALGIGVRRALIDAIEMAEQSDAASLMISGVQGCFSAGADLAELDRGYVIPTTTDVIARLEASPKISIAAIDGLALGAGFELALGCSFRVASKSAKLGFPEAAIGLIPGAGGTQRLPRLIGAEAAFRVIASSETLSGEEAERLGIVDSVLDGSFEKAALIYARSKCGQEKPAPLCSRGTQAAGTLAAQAAVGGKAKSPFAEAALKQAIHAASTLPFQNGLEREAMVFRECLASREHAALLHLRRAERDARRAPGLTTEVVARPVNSAAVIGAGTMGGGIVMCMIEAGIPTLLIDLNQDQLDTALKRIRGLYESRVTRGKLDVREVEQRMNLLRTSTDMSGIADADIVIEAVFEDMGLKKRVFAQIDTFAKPNAILASNTSTLDINEIAAVTGRPGNVVGTHFFSPANIMRLLEVIRGRETDSSILAGTIALGRRIGKVVAVVGVCEGFVGNRMIHQYFREAEFLLAEGASPGEVDSALMNFGLPMGPFAMSDLAGNDIRSSVESERAKHRPAGHRQSNILAKVAEAGRYGQKTNLGWYSYAPGSRVPVADPSLEPIFEAEAARLGIRRKPIDPDEIVKRCIYPMINEAADILAEGIASNGGTVDAIYVHGYGFPATRGGPLYWADQIGLANIVRDIERYRKEFGTHWHISPLLRDLARTGEKLATYEGR